MYRFEAELKEIPSFSSTLLDKIYRSIDDGGSEKKDLKFYTEAMQRKQRNVGGGRNRGREEEAISSFNRVRMVEKWMEKKAIEKANAERKPISTAFETKSKSRRDSDHALFFSSTSSSSDSSSAGFSSSDTESMFGTKSRQSCFAPPRPKPIRTSVSTGKPPKTEGTPFYDNKIQNFEENLIQSKSRAMRIYCNLKKVKQPISPGGRLANFINSIFTSGNLKKPKISPKIVSLEEERKVKSEPSSASSYSRSCLSKNSPGTRERLRNGDKRTVRFHESGESGSGRVPTMSRSRTEVLERSKKVEEMAKEFLRKYHQNSNSRNNKRIDCEVDDEDEDDYDDAASYSSSDLFELDHRAVVGKDRFRQELPVYETTHVDKNRAIAHGLIV